MCKETEDTELSFENV